MNAVHHLIGDDEFDSPETPQWTGRVAALSGADVTHSLHGDDIVEACEHESTKHKRPSKHVSEVVVESTLAVEPLIDGKQGG